MPWTSITLLPPMHKHPNHHCHVIGTPILMPALGGGIPEAAYAQNIMSYMTRLLQTWGRTLCWSPSCHLFMQHQGMSDASRKDHRNQICCIINWLCQKYHDFCDISTVVVPVEMCAHALLWCWWVWFKAHGSWPAVYPCFLGQTQELLSWGQIVWCLTLDQLLQCN